MKTLTLILLVAAASAFAEDAPKTAPAPQGSKSQSGPSAIPAGAIRVEPFLYKYTDPQGKTWMYRQTPFGVSKYEEQQAAAAPALPDRNPVTATDLGDTVRFEHKTPFGASQWTKKKSELTEDEQAALSRGQTRKEPSAKDYQSAGKSTEQR